MGEYVLVTFQEEDWKSGDVWAVYAHRCVGYNDDVGKFQTEKEAVDKAFSFGLPVVRGHNYESVLERLSSG